MMKETRYYYERLTFTSIELNLQFTNISSLQTYPQNVSLNRGSDQTNVSYEGLNGTYHVNKTVLENPNVPFNYDIRDSLWIVLPISIIYSTIFVIGVLGNVITCVVISRNKSMHTATNYYLFSLAISDLLLLVSGECHQISIQFTKCLIMKSQKNDYGLHMLPEHKADP